MEEIQEAERELADALALVKNAGQRATPSGPSDQTASLGAASAGPLAETLAFSPA